MSKEKIEDIYLKVKNNWVTPFIGTPEQVIEHLKENYFGVNLEDFYSNKEVITITTVKMDKEAFEKLGEWEP